MKKNTAIAYGCFLLFLLPFCLTGIFMAIMAIREAIAGDWGEAGLVLIFALVFGGAGFGLLAAALRGRQRLQEEEQRRGEHPGEPWLWLRDWAITLALPRLGAPFIFPVVFGLFDALLLIVVFQLWLGSTRVTLTPDAARVVYGPFGRCRTIAADDIDDIVLKIGMQAGKRPYYDIQIARADGKKLYAGRSVRDKREAEWLVETMAEALGL